MNNDYTISISTTPAEGNGALPVEYPADSADATDGTPATPVVGAQNEGQPQEPERPEPRQAARLVNLVVASAELFKSPADEAYATVTVGHHRETHAVTSSAFKRYLATRYYDRHDSPPDPMALKSALGVIEGRALIRGEVKEVFVRVGARNDTVYLDLGNKTWDVIEITRTGWRPAKKPPVKFRRPAGMQALPMPEPGGSINELRPFLNLESDEDFVLVVAFLVGALLPTGPYAHLQLVGEQGSGKSSLARVVRDLVDPNTVPLRGRSGVSVI